MSERLEAKVMLSAVVANNDSFGTLHTFPLGGVDVIGNDIDNSPFMEGLTASLISDVSHGTLTLDPDGTFQYIPSGTYVGVDSFVYEVSNSYGSDQATVTISVGNIAPVADNLTFDVPHSTTLSDVSVSAANEDGGTLTFSLDGGVSAGTLVFHGSGSFTYTPPVGFVTTPGNPVTFNYIADDGFDTDTGTVSINVYNIPPEAQGDTFEYPDPGVEYVEIDVLANDSDFDGDDLTIQSVTTPSDGGTATIVNNKIRYSPPSEYTNNEDATKDIYSTGTTFTYTVTDGLGGFAQAEVEAAPKTWTAWREYSRGNDDPNANIYETGQIHVELEVDMVAKEIMLKYTATSTATSLLKWVDTPYDWKSYENVTGNPSDPDAKPEYEFYQPFLFLQPVEHTDSSLVVLPAQGVGLEWDGQAETLSEEIRVKSWEDAPGTLSGTAVIQMRVPEITLPDSSTMKTINPYDLGDPLYYSAVRQKIRWSVSFTTVDGGLVIAEVELEVEEIPLGALGPDENGVYLGQVATPLRIIDSSSLAGLVYKLGYPTKPGLPRKDADPGAPGPQDDGAIPGDQRGDFASPPADWEEQTPAGQK